MSLYASLRVTLTEGYSGGLFVRSWSVGLIFGDQLFENFLLEVKK